MAAEGNMSSMSKVAEGHSGSGTHLVTQSLTKGRYRAARGVIQEGAEATN